MDEGTYWIAVGSIATTVGARIAFAGVIATVLLYHRQKTDERAAQIRADIRAVVGASARLLRLLRDGSPLISAGWEVRSVIRQTLPPSGGADDIRRWLRAEEIGLPVAISSWERSPGVRALRALVEDLGLAVRRMPGNLGALSAAGEMLVAIADDLKMTFVRLLSVPELLEQILQETQSISGADEFLNAMAHQLIASSAQYFALRYEDALESLDALLVRIADSTSTLDAPRLVALAQAKVPISTGRRIDDMRLYMRALKPFLPPTTVSDIGQLIDRVEQEVAKDTAAGRLRKKSEAARP